MITRLSLFLIAVFLMSACASYKQNVMFKTDEGFVPEPIKSATAEAELNYVVQPSDILTLQVFSGNGEKLIDPNPELSQSGQLPRQESNSVLYTVGNDGMAKFPLIGEFKLTGLTTRQAELVLQKEYQKYFADPFVKLNFQNKRVVVLGSPGGAVLPLTSENMRLTEVLAMAKGLDNNSKAQNIRVLRQNKVFVVDFSTVEGYRAGNMIIEPGDVVYIEPIRRPVSESLRDNTFLFTLVTSLVALITVLTR